MTLAAGSGFPLETTVMVGEVISVVVRLLATPPGRNSMTRPLTVTASPTLTDGLALVKTKIPSDVASSASGSGSCMLKPFDRVAVTMPGTNPTSWPSSGDRCDAPCIWWMRRVGAAIVKVNT